MSKKILAILEPDNNPPQVLDRAAWLAEVHDAQIVAVWADHDIGPLGTPFLVSPIAEDFANKIVLAQLEIVDELIAPLRDTGVDATAVVLEERPIADGLLGLIDNVRPDLVVKGTHHHSTAERSIFVDSDWHLMRSCPCPLWIVKHGQFATEPLIIAAVDPIHSHDKPAELDDLIVSAAKSVADAAAGRIELLHTYDTLAGIGAAATRMFKPIKLDIDEISDSVRDAHRQALSELASRNNIEPDAVHQLAGPARDLIPAFTRDNGADLIVMGAIARWGIKRAVIGSTAERVLDQIPCDVLIVRREQDSNGT